MRALLSIAGVGLIGLAAGLICLYVSLPRRGVPQPLATGLSSVPLRSGLAPEDKVTVHIDEADFAQCVAMYAELTGRELWPGKKSALQRFDESHAYKLSRWGWLKPYSAPSTGIVYHRDGRYSVSEVKEHLESVLKAAGFAPVPEGQHYFRLQR